MPYSNYCTDTSEAVYFASMRHWTPVEMVLLRKRIGLKQLGLAILMGTTQQQLSRIESGEAPIRLHWARLLDYIEQEVEAGRSPIGWEDAVRRGGLEKSKEKG